MDFNTLDIFLVHSSKSLISDIIQKFEDNAYNHAMIGMWIYGKPYFSEATEHGPALTPLKYYYPNQKYKLLRLKPLFDIEGYKEDMIQWILSNTGHSEYDFINLTWHQLVRFVSKRIMGKELWIGQTGKLAQKSFICGEWVATPYEIFYPGTFNNPFKIAPVDIFNSSKFSHIEIP